MSGATMDQPRDENGRFTSTLSMAQFEEFRRSLEQHWVTQERALTEVRRAMEQRFAAQETALGAAREALKELTFTHSEAHKAEHESNQVALAKESLRNDDRLRKVEDGLQERVQVLENANLITATTAQVESVAKSAVRATIGSVIAGVVSLIAGIAAIISIVSSAV